jgi:hypothetical protein
VDETLESVEITPTPALPTFVDLVDQTGQLLGIADGGLKAKEMADDQEVGNKGEDAYVPPPMPGVRAVVERFIRESCTRGPGLTVASRKFLSKLHEGLEDTYFFTAKRIGMILTDLKFAQVTVRDGRLCRGFLGLALNP